MSLENIIVIDTETGGTNERTDALCQVTLKVYDKNIIYTTYVKPTNLNYNKEAMDINGLSKEILEEKGITEEELIKNIYNFICENFTAKPEPLGQNVGFDINFLNELMRRHDKQLFSSLVSYRKRDTQAVSRFLQDLDLGLEKVGLKDAYEFFTGEQLNNAHDSEADVIATEKLYKAQLGYVDDAIEKG